MKHNDTVKYSILIRTLASYELHPTLCMLYEFINTGFQLSEAHKF